jgi:hypothetical protein
MDSKRILVSKTTMGNEIHYQLRATVQWVHVGDNYSSIRQRDAG